MVEPGVATNEIFNESLKVVVLSSVMGAGGANWPPFLVKLKMASLETPSKVARLERVVVSVILSPATGNTGEVSVGFVPSVVNLIIAPPGVEVSFTIVSPSNTVPDMGVAAREGVRLNFQAPKSLLIKPVRLATARKFVVLVKMIPVAGV